MHITTAKLLQIQNLELTIHENSITHKRKKDNHVYTDLLDKINDLKKEIPSDILVNYECIAKRYEVCVTPMLNDTCTGCFMKLPVGEANQVKTHSQTHACPNCNRFLYFDDHSAPPALATDSKGVARFSAPSLMFCDIKGKDKLDAIKNLGKAICKTGIIKKDKEFITTLLEREKLLSTAVGNGIAFPHARGNFASGLTFAFGRIKEGIDFGDGETVHLIIAFSVPTNVNKFYLEVVSKLAKYFKRPGSLERLLACESSEDMWKVISRLGN